MTGGPPMDLYSFYVALKVRPRELAIAWWAHTNLQPQQRWAHKVLTHSDDLDTLTSEAAGGACQAIALHVDTAKDVYSTPSYWRHPSNS